MQTESFPRRSTMVIFRTAVEMERFPFCLRFGIIDHGPVIIVQIY